MRREAVRAEAIRYVRRNFDEALVLGALAKAAKLAMLVALLSIPVVNVVVGACLVAKLIWPADSALRKVGT